MRTAVATRLSLATAAALLTVIGVLPGVFARADSPPSSAGATITTIGPVVAFGFERVADGLVRDSSGHGIHARPVRFDVPPGRQASVSGHGQALVFDGARQQFLDVYRDDRLNVDRFTLAAWVRYLPRVHDTRWEILEKAGAYWMNIRTDSRRLRVGGFFGGCSGGRVWHYLDSRTAIPAETWVHLAGTYDGAALTIYVDGVRDASMPVRGRTCVNTLPLAIGAKNQTRDKVVEAYFDGALDDVRVFNRALTGAQVHALRDRAVS